MILTQKFAAHFSILFIVISIQSQFSLAQNPACSTSEGFIYAKSASFKGKMKNVLHLQSLKTLENRVVDAEINLESLFTKYRNLSQTVGRHATEMDEIVNQILALRQDILRINEDLNNKYGILLNSKNLAKCFPNFSRLEEGFSHPELHESPSEMIRGIASTETKAPEYKMLQAMQTYQHETEEETPRQKSNCPPRRPQNINRGLEVIPPPNLAEYPDPIRTHPVGHELSIGDLHGNTLKLINFLVREGILTLTRESYQRLVDLYKTGGMNADGSVDWAKLDDFKKIIETAKVRSPGPTVRLIGDELGDRGTNDLFTKLVLTKLKKSGVPCEEVLSNHSLEFVKFYETQVANLFSNKYYSNILGPGQASSLENLQKFIGDAESTREKKLVKEIKQFYEETYLPNLKLISYSVDNHVDSHVDSHDAKKRVTFYSHAAVGLESLPELGKSMKVKKGLCAKEKVRQSTSELVACIDEINRGFTKLALSHKVSKTIDGEPDSGNADRSGPASPLCYVTWTRSEEYIDRPDSLGDGAELTFVHGHNGALQSGNTQIGNVVNLDNVLGKDSNDLTGLRGNRPSAKLAFSYGIYHAN